MRRDVAWQLLHGCHVLLPHPVFRLNVPFDDSRRVTELCQPISLGWYSTARFEFGQSGKSSVI